MNILPIAIGLIAIIFIIIVFVIQHEEAFNEDYFVIKRRGDKVLSVQKGGSVKSFRFIDDIISFPAEPVEISINYEFQSGDGTFIVPIRLQLKFEILDIEGKLNEIPLPNDGDYIFAVRSKIESEIKNIISIDLSGKSKIDLLKNEKRNLTELKSNIIYNIQIDEEEIDIFELKFDWY